MPNLVRKRFYRSGTFNVPAGVTKLRAIGRRVIEEKLAMQGTHSHFIDDDGDMWAFGENAGGQMGQNNTTDLASTPLIVVGSHKWRHVVLSSDGSSSSKIYAIDTDGRLYAWGFNSGFAGGGVLGTGSGTIGAYSSPTLVAGGRRWTKAFPMGDGSSFGIDSEGDLYHWGYSATQGMPPQPIVSTPLLVGGVVNWKRIFQNQDGGRVWGIDDEDNLWSVNHGGVGFAVPNSVAYDQQFPGPFDSLGGGFGTGDSNPATTSSTPLMVVGGHKWEKVVTHVHVVDQLFGIPLTPTYYGLTKTGKLYGWGFAHFGPVNTSADFIVATGLAFEGPAVVSSPTLVVGLEDKRIIDIQAVYNGSAAVPGTVFALCDDGELYAWGGNNSNSSGTGVDGDAVSTPTLVAGSHHFVKLFTSKASAAFQSGSNRVYALDVDGNLWGWGDNDGGKLGVGVAGDDPVSTPTMVIGGHKWRDLVLCDVDWTRQLGVDELGDLYQWGEVYDGDGFYTTTSSPTAVVGSHMVNPIKTPDEVIEIPVIPGQAVPVEISGVFASINGESFAKLPSEIIIEFER